MKTPMEQQMRRLGIDAPDIDPKWVQGVMDERATVAATLAVRIQLLRDRKGVVLEDLRYKVLEEDWHGVADAAMDLREIEAELRGMERA